MDIVNRQGWYLELTTFPMSWEIFALLDEIPMGLTKFLRMFIMEMTTKTNQRMFNLLDGSWNNEAVLFNYPKAYEEEACNGIAHLAPYVCFKLGDRALNKFFFTMQLFAL